MHCIHLYCLVILWVVCCGQIYNSIGLLAAFSVLDLNTKTSFMQRKKIEKEKADAEFRHRLFFKNWNEIPLIVYLLTGKVKILSSVAFDL